MPPERISIMPAVKAYELEDTILVKFYDDGGGSSLHCPHCHRDVALAQAPAWDEDEMECAPVAEMRCPDCNVRLGTLTPTRRH